MVIGYFQVREIYYKLYKIATITDFNFEKGYEIIEVKESKKPYKFFKGFRVPLIPLENTHKLETLLKIIDKHGGKLR